MRDLSVFVLHSRREDLPLKDIITVSLSSPVSSCDELIDIALALRERVNLEPQQRFGLVGVGLSKLPRA
jgi:hypothetical protein